ncbi:NIPSNAP protein [Rhizobium azibense]|uniref:NIPSNAP protein n=1 Tax=Rhizobium azibense TaxID=1136135 RepID=A0A4R3R2K1_9HYPH|nr:NIPSNAP family protein [Rhizobium azibense]TCU29223.1 NIPSNAP protein [Rhizobium azibense]
MRHASSVDNVFELRQYRLHPGARETLITVFDREFLETQEEADIRVVAQFRDLDDTDSFVWLRSFADMEARREALGRFYNGPTWARHRDAANGTMVNSDNVLLLRPASFDPTFQLPATERPRSGSTLESTALFLCSIYYAAPGKEEAFSAFFENELRLPLLESGATIPATFLSEHSANTFPRLPIREGESVFVALYRFATPQAYATHLGALAASRKWTETIQPQIMQRTWRETEVLRLSPTSRSLMR